VEEDSRASQEEASKEMKDPRINRFNLEGFNKPKRTPNHPTKSHMVLAKEGDKTKLIRFGEQGAKTNMTPEQRKAFKSRHAKNIAKGKMSAAWWANKVKWNPSKTKRK
jgi:hypothetical protein